MDLETAPSRSAQPDRRSVILRDALFSRRAEVQKSWPELLSSQLLESLGSAAGEVEAFLNGNDSALAPPGPESSGWLASDEDFWGGLYALALGKHLDCRPAAAPPSPLFPADLKRLSPPERFQRLLARYRCPANIAAASEFDVAEELLRQLMVVERTNLEAGRAFDAEGVLLALSLLGIRALITRDLRSFDALNYFFEMPRESLVRFRSNPRLFASWLCLYVQLLSTADWLQ